jgi:DNA-binding transcriptional ArsR family regulator
LGHPARVAILQHLFKINSCICGDLVLEIGLAQPTISQHLKILKSLGLIKGNVEGTRFKPTKLLLNSFKLK